MLDRLLGRAALKERIEELKEERDRMERRLDSAEESRTEAVSARQDAEERVNRLQDRVTELEDRVDRLQDDEPDLSYRRVETAQRGRAEEVVRRLERFETDAEGALTAFVDDEAPEEVRDLLGDHAVLVDRAAPCLVCVDDAGLVAAALSLPVTPDPFAEWGESFRVEREWFRPTGTVAFGLVRSDLFAMGVYEGTERVDFEGFESDVMNKHSKGGFSQDRFERRRDSQVEEHLEESREVIDDMAGDADRVVLVGERSVLPEVRDLADDTAAVDATGAPKAALSDAFEDFWTVRVYAI